LFDIKWESANTYGWHFAHIFDVKDGDTSWFNWTRPEVVRRFIRNIHPCNVFLLPKTDWTTWGGDSRVLGYVASRYAVRYADVWHEFISMARAQAVNLAPGSGAFTYLTLVERSASL